MEVREPLDSYEFPGDDTDHPRLRFGALEGDKEWQEKVWELMELWTPASRPPTATSTSRS